MGWASLRALVTMALNSQPIWTYKPPYPALVLWDYQGTIKVLLR
jgi:hypothetical protein